MILSIYILFSIFYFIVAMRPGHVPNMFQILDQRKIIFGRDIGHCQFNSYFFFVSFSF